MPKFAYNYLGNVTTIGSPRPLPAGRVTISYDFAYDGGKPGAAVLGQSPSTGRRSVADESNARSLIFSASKRQTWEWIYIPL